MTKTLSLQKLSLLAIAVGTIGLSALVDAAPASAAFGCPPGLRPDGDGDRVPFRPRPRFDRYESDDPGPGWRRHRYDNDDDFDRPSRHRCDPGKHFDPRRGYCVRR